jgi:hypothetical protein
MVMTSVMMNANIVLTDDPSNHNFFFRQNCQDYWSAAALQDHDHPVQVNKPITLNQCVHPPHAPPAEAATR